MCANILLPRAPHQAASTSRLSGIVQNNEQFVGVDIGGTTVKLGSCDARGRVLARHVVPFDAATPADAILERIAAGVRTLAGDGAVTACGVGIPGELDVERRTLARANHLPEWKHVRIPDMLAESLGAPVVVENDANCAAWGESRAGVGRGARALVLVTLGTGVGGGVVLAGRLWTGVGGAAGALGHVVIDPAGPLCKCGQRGCLEQYASATSVARRAKQPSAEAAFAAAALGEVDALAAVGDACAALASAAAATVHLLQPDLFVLGGGMAAAGDQLLQPVRDGLRARVRASWLTRTRVELAALGKDAGWIGAALWAAHSLRGSLPDEHHAPGAMLEHDAR